MATSAQDVEKGASFFRYEVEDGVAVITFDDPDAAVNTLSPVSGKQFEDLVTRANADAQVKAVVFLSGKRDSFIAGAKIDFLQTLTSAAEAERMSREGQAAFDRLEANPKPVVAAIHGSCLGGGLEWVMACHYRIATDSPKTSLGLPEVQIGLLPGGGGTQRLPELIGAQAALDIILAGKSVKARKALKLGIVDEVVPQPILRQLALERARALAGGKLEPRRREQVGLLSKLRGQGGGVMELALEDNPVGRRVLFEQAKKQLREKTHGKYPAPEKALEAVRVGLDKGRKAGLEAEARLFGELVMTDVHKRLVELFFATTALKKENGAKDPSVKARKVEKVAVLGGGLMGGGIAYVTSTQQGVPVRIKERDDAGVGRALKHVQGLIDERVKRKSITWREASEQMARVSATTDYSGFKSVDLVIEAVFEDLKLKHRILAETEAATREDCIFASNTSSIPITEIAQGSKRPETVIGMHYFSPVNKMPLLEIIVHPGTADWVTATCVEVGRRQGKTVIVVNDGVGFYTSRILAPYMNEAAYLLAEGADIAELDRALVDFGFPVGPVTLLDEVGIDVAHKVGPIMEAAFGSRLAAPKALAKVVEDGRQGRKNKRGFYTYDGKKKEVDRSVYDLMPHGQKRVRMDRKEMAERLALTMVNEAIRCLEEGVLRSARDGDVGAIFGLGFPPFLGGPFRYADSVGLSRLLTRLERLQEKHGERFAPAPLLLELAKENRTFHPR